MSDLVDVNVVIETSIMGEWIKATENVEVISITSFPFHSDLHSVWRLRSSYFPKELSKKLVTVTLETIHKINRDPYHVIVDVVLDKTGTKKYQDALRIT